MTARAAAGSRPLLRSRGLTTSEAEELLARDGRNVLPEPGRASPVRALLRQLTHLLALLLWVAAGLVLWVAAGLALLGGMPALAAAIVVIVILNGVFAFWQEYRADRSTQRLRALLPAATRVVRDGVPRPVDVADLVVGDLLLLEAGDRVGAERRVHRRRWPASPSSRRPPPGRVARSPASSTGSSGSSP